MTAPLDLGLVRCWLEGDILYAENDFLKLAWAQTNDPEKFGKFGWHGPRQIGVEYVGPDEWKRLSARITVGQ